MRPWPPQNVTANPPQTSVAPPGPDPRAGADHRRAGQRRQRHGTLQHLLVAGHEQPQRRHRLQLAGEHLVHVHADRLPALGQQPDHPGRRQRPGERHLLLARPGGRRRARSGGVVGDAELHDHGRERQRAGHARARADPGLHHVPPARDRVHLVDPRPGRRDVRLGDLARRPELRVEQHVPAGQPRPDGVHLRHGLRGHLLLARLRRERRRGSRPAVERDLVHLLLQQPHRAAAGAAVPHQRARR